MHSVSGQLRVDVERAMKGLQRQRRRRSVDDRRDFAGRSFRFRRFRVVRGTGRHRFRFLVLLGVPWSLKGEEPFRSFEWIEVAD